MPTATAYLVESIPVGLEELRGTPGVSYTEDVLLRLTNAAQHSIDLTAMYWSLVPDPTGKDESGFTDAQFEAFGSAHGQALYAALHAAAARGVQIRILQSPGSAGPTPESAALLAQHPQQVQVHQVSLPDWYGGGIMHQKIWVFDRRHLYLGSVNMDWKSISQVKEMGVAIEHCAPMAEDATRYFEGWWLFGGMAERTAAGFDAAARLWRKLPDWSALLPRATRQPSPLASPLYSASGNLEQPLAFELDGQRCSAFLTGSPPELCGPGRTHDADALVHTVMDAQQSVCISVMDLAPVSLYPRKADAALSAHDADQPLDTPVWWPVLMDTLLNAALTRKLKVRLLVSHWAHSSPVIDPFLRALQQMATAGGADTFMAVGSLEIRHFIVPGWDSTLGEQRQFPGHTRVNHTKFIVTDRRINIGTSNMTWDYFAETAGSSFNTDHPALVHTLQAVFDRDWNSAFASPL